jgi:hypothetical protein
LIHTKLLEPHPDSYKIVGASSGAAQEHFANIWQSDWGSLGMQHQSPRNPLD